MLTPLKLLPCLIKQSLKTQKKLKELKMCAKIQSVSVFLDTAKFGGFRWKNADVSKTQGVCHMIHLFFGSPLGKV